jgi:hypothetical protein
LVRSSCVARRPPITRTAATTLEVVETMVAVFVEIMYESRIARFQPQSDCERLDSMHASRHDFVGDT